MSHKGVARTFTVRFPFQVAPGQEVSGLDRPNERRLGTLTLRLERQPPYYILQVEGFESEAAARAYLDQLRAGLAWALLVTGVAFRAESALGTISYAQDPDQAAENLHRNFGLPLDGPIHGLADGNMPVVYPSGKRIRFITVGQPTVIGGTGIDLYLDALVEGLGIPGSARVVTDPSLSTALELYAAYYYEQSANARLLTLVMALEVLTASRPKHQVALDLLDQWKEQIKQQRGQFHPESEEFAALDALHHQLFHSKEASLRSKVRALVQDALKVLGNPDVGFWARHAVVVYDKRSTLVHKGHLPANELTEATRDAKALVELVLRARFHPIGLDAPGSTLGMQGHH